MKKLLMLLIATLIVSLSLITAFAHGGRTDGNGGHYDRDSGEYHYHHGYSAHQHENGVCPYEEDDTNEGREPTHTRRINREQPNRHTTRALTTIDNSENEETSPILMNSIAGISTLGVGALLGTFVYSRRKR